MEQGKLKDVNEVLLIDDAGRVYEGMSSNFFAVRVKEDGSPVLVTAPLEHVLLGTVMKIVMAVCEQHRIPIEWTFPCIQDARAGKWEGCFLTSMFTAASFNMAFFFYILTAWTHTYRHIPLVAANRNDLCKGWKVRRKRDLWILLQPGNQVYTDGHTCCSAAIEFPHVSDTVEMLRQQVRKEISSRAYKIL